MCHQFKISLSEEELRMVVIALGRVETEAARDYAERTAGAYRELKTKVQNKVDRINKKS